ncbi:MAG: PAS domain S-box protein, partial [Chloroflexota bacterium]|nr:PAS domain S-box protein [Chloroflexota bacterium]
AETTSDTTFALDLDGNFTYVSPVVERLTGFSWQDFLGCPFTEVIAPEYVESIVERFEKGLTGEKIPLYEIELRHKDGETVPVELNVSSLLDATGKTTGRIGVARDITDRREAGEAQRESEKKYRELFEKSEDAILIIHNGKFVDCNQSAIKMLHYNKKDELLNMHPSELSPEKQPDGKISFTKADEMMKIALKNGSNRFEWYHKKSDGEIFPVEVLLTSISDDEKNQILHTTWRDITDRKRADEAMKKSEERFRTIFESREEGFAELDLAGRITFFNETMLRIMGFPAEELMGMSYREYMSPETVKRMYGIFGKIYRTGESAEITNYEIIRKDGGKRTMELSAYLIRDENGDPAGFRGITRDVTKRKEMEEELERRFQYLEGVLAAAPYAIIALDRHHRIIRWNPEAENLFGYSQEEVIGKELDSLVAGTDTMEEANRATKVTMSGEILPPWEAVRFRKDGSPVDVTVGGSPIMVDGKLIGAVVIYDDITDRKQAEEGIRSHQKHIKLINQILRHDLTNDLVVIQSAINLYNNSPEEELLKEISSHAGKSIELISRMRDLESFISRHKELQIHEMRDIIDEVV